MLILCNELRSYKLFFAFIKWQRDNLRRRKEQARAREPAPAEPTDGEATGGDPPA